MTANALKEIRAVCLSFPEAREVAAWGAPTFRVKTIFAIYATPDEARHPDAPAVWIKATPDEQSHLVRMDPARFFVPPYVGPKGWIGVVLHPGSIDWVALRQLLWDGWRRSVPKGLAATYGEEPPE